MCSTRRPAPNTHEKHPVEGNRTQSAHGSIWQRVERRKQDLINGKFEHMLDTASKVAGLTRKQYRDWRRTGKLEAKKENGRSRSISRIRKKREETWGQTERERRAQRDKTKDGHRKKKKGGEMRSAYTRKKYRKKRSKYSKKPTGKKPTEQNRESTEDGKRLTEKEWMHGQKS